MPTDPNIAEEESEHKEKGNEVLPIQMESAETAEGRKEQTVDTPPSQNTFLPSPQPSTEAMDVHHHTHTGRKKWKHYLFEFFMLFLAVFCGFLAEYQLEHVIENNREKQYMRSLIEDLQADTSKINRWLRIANDNLSYVDSSLIIITNGNLTDSLADKLYRFYFPAFGLPGMVFTDRTSLQLKSSGSMRLIRKHIVADSILDYWNYITQITGGAEKLEYYRIRGRELGFKIFNISARYVRNRGLPEGRTITSPLIANNPQLLVEYGNHMAFMSAEINRSYRQGMIDQRNRAGHLINLIRKEYNLQ